MFPTYTHLRRQLTSCLRNKKDQGHQTSGLDEELARIPDSYDAFNAFAQRVASLPMRPDWPYREPNSLAEILAEADPARPRGRLRLLPETEARERVKAAFIGSVCGCILGKPLEIQGTLAGFREVFEPRGEWPLRDYISGEVLEAFGKLHPDWTMCVRESIRYVAPDDDINYTITGMLILEQKGLAFTPADVATLWLYHVPIGFTWGPERTMLVKRGLMHLCENVDAGYDLERMVAELNPSDEFCGALIRVDAYGYACLGHPALAAELAWRDSSWTHRRTGIYGSMFIAAAIAAAPCVKNPLEIVEIALRFVPQRSRFYERAKDCLEIVRQAPDWISAYGQIHEKLKEFTHCWVYQEIGTLINTLRFATSVDDGFCKQVMQGNDTDSFGARAGAILGAYFGPGHLDERWVRPFNNKIHIGLSHFFERDLDKLADRLAKLPALTAST